MGGRKGGLAGLGNVLRDDLSLFSGRTVLVTGHTGFKGSWLSLWLHRLGARVIGYALAPQDDDGMFRRGGIAELLTDVRGDIRDHEMLFGVLSKYQPEIVFHMAARTIVRESYREPKETFDVNVGGTVNLLEACRLNPSIRAVVVVTSDKCYENTGRAVPFRERDRLGGHDPYSASKACAELASAAYERSFFTMEADSESRLGLATARAGNVIGGGDWASDRIVPDCMRALRAGKPVSIRNPGHTRPWQFVLEPLAGYLDLAARLFENPDRYSGAWNFGPDLEAIVPVRDLAEKIIRAYGSGAVVDAGIAGQPVESKSLSLNALKAKMKLGWRPALSLDEAVAMTVGWYKCGIEGRDMRDYSLGQIEDYSRLRRGMK